MAPHPNCRIGTVTLKASGFKIHRLSDSHERTRERVMGETRACFDNMTYDGREVVGFALVMWDSDGGSDAVLRAYPGSNIPSIAMPDFVKNRLLAQKIMEWSRE